MRFASQGQTHLSFSPREQTNGPISGPDQLAGSAGAQIDSFVFAGAGLGLAGLGEARTGEPFCLNYFNFK